MDHEIKDHIQSSYNTNSRLRDQAEIEQWKIDELDWFASRFEKPEGLKLLDAGAGAGQHGQYLQSKGFDVHCIDNSVEMVNCCRGRGLTASHMDFYRIEFPKASYDAVWSMNALLHVPKKSLPAVLENLRGVLKPGGLFYLGLYGGVDSEGTWEGDPYTPKRFFSFFTHEEMRSEIGKYFEVAEFKVLEMPGMTMDFHSMLLRRIGG